MEFAAKIRGSGNKGTMRILIDDYDTGEEIGKCEIGKDDGVIHAVVASVTGRHSVYFVFDDGYRGYFGEFFKGRPICELESFVFHK
jgi:hypothetical protein